MGYPQGYAISSVPFGDTNAGSPVLNVEGKVIGILYGSTLLSGLEGDSEMSNILPLYPLKSWIELTLRSSGYTQRL